MTHPCLSLPLLEMQEAAKTPGGGSFSGRSNNALWPDMMGGSPA